MAPHRSNFPRLLSPVHVGPLELKNRIVMPAMHLNFTPEGLVTDRMVEFFRQRAHGGAAMIIVGACRVAEHGGAFFMLDAYSDKADAGLKKLSDGIREGGSVPCLQIFHAGAYVHTMLIGGKPPVSASEGVSGFTGETARELSLEEIKDVVSRFGRSAKKAADAGWDAVEVCGSAGYLISQFISPKTNKRTDEYGGSEEKRMRFGLEVAEAVRRAIGPDRALLFRLAGNEFVPGGNTNQAAGRFAAALAGAGVDAFNVTGGWHETRVPQLTAHVPPGAFVYLAQGVQMEAGKPTMACNRINDPAQAEHILQDYAVDLIGMGRALIADPMLPLKAMEGRADEIIHCLACNQGCFDAVFRMEPSCCMINPMAGREVDLLEKGAAACSDAGSIRLVPVQERKTVVVVGAGPAGLAASRAAALRGHNVTLLERSHEPGGQLKLAGAMRDRAGFLRMAQDLTRAARKAGVHIEFDVLDALARIRKLKPDVVVLATGARPADPPFPIDPGADAATSWQVLSGQKVPGRRVAVVGAGATGCETALELARHGSLDAETVRFLLTYGGESPEEIRARSLRGVREITLLDMERKPARDVGKSYRWVLLYDLKAAGVNIMTGTLVREVVPGAVVVERKSGDETRTERLECDTVVLASGVTPNRELEEKLAAEGFTVNSAGDVVKPARALEAVRAGFDAGVSI